MPEQGAVLFSPTSRDGEQRPPQTGAGRVQSYQGAPLTHFVTSDTLAPLSDLSFPICKVGLKRDISSGLHPGGQAAPVGSNHDLYATGWDALEPAQGPSSLPAFGESPGWMGDALA